MLDDERLKGKNVFGADYFDDLLDRIREIRISERRYYQKITDIYSECSSDYDKDSEETQLFFKTVQNMMHYAVTKQTAAEIIYDRVDAERPHMGLTTWKNAPDGRVVKSDVTVAKNYLSEKEVDSLNRLSNAFIDIAEQRAEDHILMTMADWSALLQRYMDLNNRPLLPDAGRVTHVPCHSGSRNHERLRQAIETIVWRQEGLIFIIPKFSYTTTHTSTRTSSIEIQSFSDYVKSNSKENTYVHAQGRDHWHGPRDV